ncbi:hypothetical protein TRFO_14305 [Tritrichomonas foetus]|uniref:PDEase domain-containing protein n=1 Tax=Tritrichomonas foetus TaxID=1144522 RepID=A0A1J4KVJ5_9EUKA|nr:hypothetical protein TRFO_14305 [Tritrichomonas foetus]|eukprot:OHT15259.1 hypothetical protein TRFO_14305 [Tritrichomonas foetus]
MKCWDRLTASQPLVIAHLQNKKPEFPKIPSIKETTKTCLSSLSKSISTVSKEMDGRLAMSRLFDEMMSKCLTKVPYRVFEKYMMKFFHTQRAVFWEMRPNSNTYLSKTLKSEVSANISLIREITFSHKPILPEMKYDPEILTQFSIQSYDHQFFIPLRYPDGSMCAIIQLSRHQNCSPFDENDSEIGEFIIKKFAIYGASLFQKERVVGLASKMSKIGPLAETVQQITETLSKTFQCTFPDIWFLQIKEAGFFRFDNQLKDFIGFYKCSAGSVSLALRSGNTSIISSHVGDLKQYLQMVDGEPSFPILMSSCEFGGRIWCVVLRGERIIGPYTKDDQSRLSSIIPFIARSLSFSGGFIRENETEEKRAQNAKTHMLSYASLITQTLDEYELIKIVREKGADLLNSKICRILIADHPNNKLLCDFNSNNLNHQKHYLNFGFGGASILTQKGIISSDPEKDPRFDRDIDVGQAQKSIKVRNLLVVPVFGNQNIAIGSIIVLNKNHGDFNESDQHKLSTLAIFIGIALNNAKSYHSALLVTHRIKSLLQKPVINYKLPLKESINDVLNQICKSVNATRSTLFITKNNNQLYEYTTVDEKDKNDDKSYLHSNNQKKSNKNLKFDLNQFNLNAHTIDHALSALRNKDVSSFVICDHQKTRRAADPNADVIDVYSSRDHDSTITGYIYAVPLFDSPNIHNNNEKYNDNNNNDGNNSDMNDKDYNDESNIVGVLEFSFNSSGNPGETELLETFAKFASFSFDIQFIKEINLIKEEQSILCQIIDEHELDRIITPEKMKLQIDPDQIQLFDLNFIVPGNSEPDLIKIIFHIFDQFNLKQEFEITNQVLFSFILRLSQGYKEIPYFNWNHAISTCLYLSVFLIKGNFDNSFNKIDILCMIISTLAHDVGHDGFESLNNGVIKNENNVLDVSEQTNPVFILYKNQNVLEMTHCKKLIKILSKESCNILKCFKGVTLNKIWKTLTQLILDTNMKKHLDLIEKYENLNKDEHFSLTSNDHKILLMTLLLKCADLGDLLKEPDYINDISSFICEEFFIQGPIEIVLGMEYTHEDHTRENLDKENSQLGFFKFIAFPLFDAVCEYVPNLKYIREILINNLEKWSVKDAQRRVEQAKQREEENVNEINKMTKELNIEKSEIDDKTGNQTENGNQEVPTITSENAYSNENETENQEIDNEKSEVHSGNEIPNMMGNENDHNHDKVIEE